MIVGRALYEAAQMLGPLNPLEMAGGIRHIMKHPDGEDPANGNLTEAQRLFLADGLTEGTDLGAGHSEAALNAAREGSTVPGCGTPAAAAAETTSAAFAEELETWARYAFAAYGGSEDRFAERARVSKDDLILYNTRATACRPAFAVVADSQREAIVLAIRVRDTWNRMGFCMC